MKTLIMEIYENSDPWHADRWSALLVKILKMNLGSTATKI